MHRGACEFPLPGARALAKSDRVLPDLEVSETIQAQHSQASPCGLKVHGGGGLSAGALKRPPT